MRLPTTTNAALVLPLLFGGCSSPHRAYSDSDTSSGTEIARAFGTADQIEQPQAGFRLPLIPAPLFFPEASVQNQQASAPAALLLPVPDPCGSAALVPDVTYFVPQDLDAPESDPVILPSGGAKYYYRGTPFATCNSWVVDFKMATYSNTEGDPANLGRTVLDGQAYDLPSSGVIGGVVPNNQIDCERYRVDTTYFFKGHQDTEFTRKGTNTRQGVWTTQCNFVETGITMPFEVLKSLSGFDVHRLAIRVKLRSSGQEAAGYLWDGPND